ncbi:MAG: IS3 family transposase, partial [Nitrospinaceae bacterium]
MEIEVAHKESKKVYGIPRIHAELNEKGNSFSRHRVTRLMRGNRVASKQKKKFRV